MLSVLKYSLVNIKGKNLMSVTTELRQPSAEDGASLFDLVGRCPPLDPNSLYCNLLQCSHMADTCVAAFNGTSLVGFVSAYRIPANPETLFVWQVAIDECARGAGLASKMLSHLLARNACQGVRFIETTITPDNKASWALFERLASHLKTSLERSVLFDKETHFAGRHDSEMLARIGPF